MTWKRVFTAAVLIPIVVSLVLYGGTPVVTLAVALITVLALFEYFALGDAIGHRAYRFWTATCSLLLLFIQWALTFVRLGEFDGWIIPSALRFLFSRVYAQPGDVFFVFVLGIAAIMVFSRRPLVEGLPAAGISASGLLLVAFPLSYAVRLHAAGPQGPALLLFAMVIIWAGDTAAYFVGRSIGRLPLAPHLSPKKTWEGSLASLIGSFVVAYFFSWWIYAPGFHLYGMAFAGNAAGQVGDLLESAYKRSAGVKDSGSLLPGHGGILDRIDALILAIPVVWYYWILIVPPSA